MRRLIGVLTAALLVLPATAGRAAPAQDSPGGGTIQAAITMFFHVDGRGLPLMYFGGAIAFDVVDASGFAGRARCHENTRHGKRIVVCAGSATGVELGPTDFSMDPLLREAHVAFDQGKYHESMDWSNDMPPQTDFGVDTYGAGVQVFSEADASGRILGYDFSERRDHPLGFLTEGASANVSSNGVHVRRSADGVVHVRMVRTVQG
jgi:hypothetical protein